MAERKVSSHSMQSRLVALSAGIACFSLLVGVISLWGASRVRDAYQPIAVEQLPQTRLLGEMFLAFRNTRIAVRTLAISGLSNEKMERVIEDAQKEIALHDKLAAEFEKEDHGRDERERYQAVKASWTKFKEFGGEMVGLARKKDSAFTDKMRSDILNVCPKFAQAYMDEMNALLELQTHQANEQVAMAESRASQTTALIAVSVVFAFLSAFLLGFYFARNLSGSLGAMISRLTDSSSQVASASEQVSQASTQLSSVSQEQAASIQQTASALTEISGIVESNVKHAEGAQRTIHDATRVSEEARRSMMELSAAIQKILEGNEKIAKMVEVIRDIGEKTEMIDEIVFKTQLLSFNASVEAERAGEHGRGFAVVAQEVGNLAQLSGKAAAEIGRIVKDSMQEAEAIVRENRGRVEAGGVLSKDTQTRMEETVRKLNEVIENAGHIVQSSKEQFAGIHQITQSVNQLNQSTQVTSSTSEEAASAAKQLAAQSENMMVFVDELNRIVRGASALAAQARPAPAREFEPRRANVERRGNVIPLQRDRAAETKTTVTGEPKAPDKWASGGWDRI